MQMKLRRKSCTVHLYTSLFDSRSSEMVLSPISSSTKTTRTTVLLSSLPPGWCCWRRSLIAPCPDLGGGGSDDGAAGPGPTHALDPRQLPSEPGGDMVRHTQQNTIDPCLGGFCWVCAISWLGHFMAHACQSHA